MAARDFKIFSAVSAFIQRWRKRETWRYEYQRFDYGVVLPLLARLPLSWAYWLSDLRGAYNAKHARDWAELSVGFPYVGERTANGFRDIFPKASEDQIAAMVIQRYQTVAREELDGVLAIRGRLGEIHMDLETIRKALAQRTPGRGLVVVMGHFDSVFLGLIGMVRCGEAVYLMTSDIVLDPRVHETLRNLYTVKYRRYAEQMGGGQLLPTSSASRQTFYKQLAEGGMVVVATDTPAGGSADKGTWVQWFGKRRKMADSALRMAIETGSEIMGMATYQVAPGQFFWEGTPLVDPKEFSHLAEETAREKTFAPLVKFFESNVRNSPGRWWAAHLHGDFQLQETAHED